MSQILIVEDDESVRTMIKSALVQEGHVVREAPNGRVAMKSLSSQMPDLIVTDLLMPEQEGIETIVEVRRKFPGVKIIAISGGMKGAKFDLLGLAAKIGADRTLAKPFSILGLLVTVEELLAANPVKTPPE